jgi:nitronate monooxygenase
MLATPLSRKLGLKAPIFQAPMAGVTTPELVLEVGKAGALGAFGFAFTEPEAMKTAVQKVRDAADVPIHINLFVEPQAPGVLPNDLRAAVDTLRPAFKALGVPAPETVPPPYCPDLSAQIEAALALRPAVMSSHFHPFAPAVISDARRLGILIGCSATTLEEALQLEAAGVDFIIAQGAEAGGHRGTFDADAEPEMIGTLALTRMIVKRCRTPVVGAGGIMDGAGIAAVLALGAQAAQLGTAFVPCPESGAPRPYKQAMLTRGDNGTTLTRAFSGRPARSIRNRFSELAQDGPFLRFPAQLKFTVPLRVASNREGSAEYMPLWAGQAYPLATEAPAGALIARWMHEAEEALAAVRT